MTSGNNVYVVWTDTTTAGPEDILLLFKRNCRMVKLLNSYPINLSMNAGQKFSPQIAISGNNVYVVWTDQTTAGNGNFDILFKRIAGSWT